MVSSSSPLRFRKDGRFKIMQIADTQEIPDVSPDTLKLLDAAIERECPDLVVFTGDQIKGYGVTFRGASMPQKVKATFDKLLEPITRRNIPFAVTFGNHDKQVGLTNKQQYELYRSYEQCVSPAEPDSPDGLTHMLPILSSDGKRTAFAIYMIDSQGDAKGGGYEAVGKEQLSWYASTRDRLAKQEGRMVPSFVFQHIPLPEFYHVLERVDAKAPGAVRAYRTHKNEYYRLDEAKVQPGGFLKEPPSIPDKNTGEYKVLAEKGDILGVFVGHDHNNSFIGRYQAMDFGYTPGCGFHVYGPGVDRAVRIFELDEKNPAAYQTHTVSFRDLFGKKVHSPIKEFFYVHSPTTVDAAIPLITKSVCAIAGAVGTVAGLSLLLRKK